MSSHSPLFLLGMEDKFGADKVSILELPKATPINSEKYTEFGKAFEYFQSTENFRIEIEKRFAKGTIPLVLTEGSLDVRYIQHAFNMWEKTNFLIP